MFKSNRVISLLLSFCLSFFFFTCGRVESSATDGTENINTIDMELVGSVADGPLSDSSLTEWVDITDDVDVVLQNYGYVRYTFPHVDEENKRIAVVVSLFDNFTFNSEHEYSIKFQWFVNISLASVCQVSLDYYDNDGELIKEQIIVNQACEVADLINSIDCSFKPDVSDISGGYTCKLRISIMQTGYNSQTVYQRFFISDEIELIDKDDDSGWFQKILNAIKAIPDNIKSFFENLGTKIDALGDKIGTFFTDLGENILEGIKSLFVPSETYFQDKLDEMDLYLEEHLGALYQAPQTMIHFIGLLIELEPEQPAITMPAIEFMWDGELITLTEPIEYTFEWVNDSSHPLFYFYKFYRGFVTLMLVLFFVNYCKHKYNVVFSGGVD